MPSRQVDDAVVHDLVQEIAVMAHQQDGARIVLQEAFEPERRFEIEMVGGLVEQQRDRAARTARAARATRIRQPPEKSLQGRACAAASKPRPARISAARAFGRMRLDIDQAAHGSRRCGPASLGGLRFGQQRGALGVGGQHASPPGCPALPGTSWSSMPMRQSFGYVDRAGIRMELRRRSMFSKVDLPVPLRPTMPAWWPAGRLKPVEDRISRPAIR